MPDLSRKGSYKKDYIDNYGLYKGSTTEERLVKLEILCQTKLDRMMEVEGILRDLEKRIEDLEEILSKQQGFLKGFWGGLAFLTSAITALITVIINHYIRGGAK